MIANQEIKEKLQQSSSSLLMCSESDYPFEIVLWEDENLITPDIILQRGGYPQSTIVETTSLNDFFGNCAFPQDWHNQTQKEQVHKFQNLINVLNRYLQDIQVFRIGEISIDVFILGKTDNNNIAGLKTTVIET